MNASSAKFLLVALALVFVGVATSQQAKRTHTSAAKILAAQTDRVRAAFESEGLIMLDEMSPEGHVRALVRFEQPRRRVIRLLSQTARHHEFRPELKEIESHGWDESGTLETHRMRIMFIRIDYRLRTQFDWPGYRIWWGLDPDFDNGLEEVEGFWELFELDHRNTLGRFGTKVSVGAGLPNWVQDSVTRKNVPQAMHNVKRWVDTDGKYRP